MIILMQQVLIVCTAASLTFHLFASRGEGEAAPQSPPAPAAEAFNILSSLLQYSRLVQKCSVWFFQI